MMTRRCVIGVDIGTSSSKGVLIDLTDGRILQQAAVTHVVKRPRTGWVEMDAGVWWEEFVHLARHLLSAAAADGLSISVAAVGVSGMGPCVLLVDEAGQPIRPAILYGIDTRATAQMDRMTAELGEDDIAQVGGSALTTQSAGPKILWVADQEPEAYARANRLFMPASWLVHRLTDAYVLDHQSASQTTPLYNIDETKWHTPWWEQYAAGIEPPRLAWANDIVGEVTAGAARETGIPAGTPVIAGTIDAWAEAVSVGADRPGDLMLMYGTTMFLILTGEQTVRTPSMWTTVGATPGTRNLAGGLATSGALTSWVAELTNANFAQLLTEAETSGVGARGLLMLPYFAGERTPILDPNARGVIAGLTLQHGRGDLYRAALEATAFGIRHNIETMLAAGAEIRRVVAVGGGTQGALWLQIVSDVTGLVQEVPRTTVGASYGTGFLAAAAVTDGAPPSIDDWNPAVTTIRPNLAHTARYDERYAQYRDLYRATTSVVHALATEGTTP